MLFDTASVAAVMTDALGAMADGAVWAQTSTVGIDGTAELAGARPSHGVGFVDAPVLGTRQPAEDGKLTVLAAGPTDLRDAVAPVFDAIGARTVWVGEEPGAAHRLKLVVNAWVLSVVAGTAAEHRARARARARPAGLPRHDRGRRDGRALRRSSRAAP